MKNIFLFGSQLLFFAIVTTGCTPATVTSGSRGIDECIATAPDAASGSTAVSADVSADLTLLKAAPIKADVVVKFNRDFSDKWQTVAEKNQACGMLLQTQICYVKSNAKNEADALFPIIDRNCRS
ncbi:hypothetical protein [Burkholderia cepacia]|uniref:hypothetical protein n=1 Tax=Burkholderia cepacia TaxID=292 RepID=UPI0012D9557F|nr:hypothetical protein [Burkholderia cepacia]